AAPRRCPARVPVISDGSKHRPRPRRSAGVCRRCIRAPFRSRPSMSRVFLLMAALLVTAAPAPAQVPDWSTPAAKAATAVRVPDGAVELDGVLDEAVWATASSLEDFRQKEPEEGAPATDRMEVRFVYDDEALYVGARMYSNRKSTRLNS